VVSKQLLPVYKKPMIFYPFQTLIDAEINDVLIITNPEDLNLFEKLFKDYASDNGINISFKVQKEPNGIAEAFIIAEEWINSEGCVLILGDNIFISKNIKKMIIKAKDNIGATIFAYNVPDPERYGVIEFDDKNIISIEEKPIEPKSSWAVTGLYVYDETVTSKAKKLKPSERGEIEITDINSMYLNEKKLFVEFLEEDSHWLDAGTHDSLLEAANLIKKIEK
tara:strand:+ start:1964 stop:2632 length:669 start_codon:yes stop_codon:yes gene_type:complete